LCRRLELSQHLAKMFRSHRLALCLQTENWARTILVTHSQVFFFNSILGFALFNLAN